MGEYFLRSLAFSHSKNLMPLLSHWLCVSPSTRRLQHTATLAASQRPRTASSSSSGKCQGPQEVLLHEQRPVLRFSQEQQLPHQVGGLRRCARYCTVLKKSHGICSEFC